MPRGDGTGPMGTGPMTGRAAGYCAGYSVPGYMNPVPGTGRGGFGYGRGFGRGRGWGRGFGRGRGSWAYPYGGGYYAAPYAGNFYAAPYGEPNNPQMSPKQEVDMLKAEAKVMQDEIEVINQRIRELESAQATEDKK